MSRDNKLSADSSQDKYDVILLDYGRNKVATIKTIINWSMRSDWSYQPGTKVSRLEFTLNLVNNLPACVAIEVDYETAEKYKHHLEWWGATVEICPDDECNSGKYYTGLEAVD